MVIKLLGLNKRGVVGIFFGGGWARGAVKNGEALKLLRTKKVSESLPFCVMDVGIASFVTRWKKCDHI